MGTFDYALYIPPKLIIPTSRVFHRRRRCCVYRVYLPAEKYGINLTYDINIIIIMLPRGKPSRSFYFFIKFFLFFFFCFTRFSPPNLQNNNNIRPYPYEYNKYKYVYIYIITILYILTVRCNGVIIYFMNLKRSAARLEPVRPVCLAVRTYSVVSCLVQRVRRQAKNSHQV